MCVRFCTRNRVLRVDCEFSNYDFATTSEEDREDKGSILKAIQGIKGITSGFDNTNGKTFFNHSSSAPSLSTASLLTKIVDFISKTNVFLPNFGKTDS